MMYIKNWILKKNIIRVIRYDSLFHIFRYTFRYSNRSWRDSNFKGLFLIFWNLSYQHLLSCHNSCIDTTVGTVMKTPNINSINSWVFSLQLHENYICNLFSRASFCDESALGEIVMDSDTTSPYKVVKKKNVMLNCGAPM